MDEFHVDQLYMSPFPAPACGNGSARRRTDAAAEIRAVLARCGAARVILASAPSQNELLDALTGADLDWSCVTIFHMDEYAGLDARTTPPVSVATSANTSSTASGPPPSTALRAKRSDAVAECARYAALLAQAPIDLVCLGIGENGHIAFNDPPVAQFGDPAGRQGGRTRRSLPAATGERRLLPGARRRSPPRDHAHDPGVGARRRAVLRGAGAAQGGGGESCAAWADRAGLSLRASCARTSARRFTSTRIPRPCFEWSPCPAGAASPFSPTKSRKTSTPCSASSANAGSTASNCAASSARLSRI